MPKATLLWAKGSRAWALYQIERFRQAGPIYEFRDGHKVNVTEEAITRAEARLADAEELIRKLEKN
jgi:hypothetical protein